MADSFANIRTRALETLLKKKSDHQSYQQAVAAKTEEELMMSLEKGDLTHEEIDYILHGGKRIHMTHNEYMDLRFPGLFGLDTE